MKRTGLLILVVALTSLVGLAANPSEAAKRRFGGMKFKKSQLIVCQGGGKMKARYQPEFNRLWIWFRSAAKGAKAKPPGPGECALVNRPISKNEPRSLRYYKPKNRILSASIYYADGRWQPEITKNIPVRTLVLSMTNQLRFYVRAYDNKGKSHGGKFWIVTKIGQ